MQIAYEEEVADGAFGTPAPEVLDIEEEAEEDMFCTIISRAQMGPGATYSLLVRW